MKKIRSILVLTILVAATCNAYGLSSEYTVTSIEIKSNNKICGELLSTPESSAVHKVTQNNSNTPYGLVIQPTCLFQFVKPATTSLSGKSFEIIMYNSDGSIDNVIRHDIR